MAKIRVTNLNLCRNVEQIDVSDLKLWNGRFHGTIEIEEKHMQVPMVITGGHGSREYEKEYGFIIVK